MSFELFKILGISVTRNIKIIEFINSIKDNNEIIISSKGKEMKFSKTEIAPMLNDLIVKHKKSLEKLEKQMVEAGYIEEGN